VARSISHAGVKSRAIERKLRSVESLPQEQSRALLGEVVDVEEDILLPEID
jgi:hypothetical protein